MKKLFIISMMAFTSLFSSQTATANVSLNVRLYPIQTIMVNPTQSTVNLDYATTANYTDGVSLNQANHLTVYSTGGFIVSIKSPAATLSNTINTETINASDIKITASVGSANALAGVTYAPTVSLSTTSTTLFSSTTGGFNKNFNVNYTSKGDQNAYGNKYYSTQSPTVYSTDVVYEIVAN